MSILIKGMKMPITCDDCFLPLRYCPYAMKPGGECPLIEPPTPHGRLIDACALIDAIIAKYIRHERHRELVFTVAQIKQDLADIINRLPTIIEAEEDE